MPKRLPVWRLGVAAILIVVGLVAGLAPAHADTITLDLGSGDNSLTERIVQLVVLITVLSLVPSILVMVTSFVRIVVVLSLLRMAIGLQTAPPNSVIVALALFLTAFIMAPTFENAYRFGVQPYLNDEVEIDTAFDLTTGPFKTFMLSQVREDDLRLFFDMAQVEPPETPDATPLRVLVPAFMVGELRRAFEIGFLIFVPFLVIDMVVASILLSMGMMMLPPIIISLPFKLIFFVLVDGWNLIAGSLVKSFGTVPL
ncbi:MAG: flagellar type III secretion system pore protein FliP [Pseudomonadota bacterium]